MNCGEKTGAYSWISLFFQNNGNLAENKSYSCKDDGKVIANILYISVEVDQERALNRPVHLIWNGCFAASQISAPRGCHVLLSSSPSQMLARFKVPFIFRVNRWEPLDYNARQA